MSLSDPTKKMSKSDPNPKAYIALLDDINVAKKKIKSAVTDLDMKVKYDEVNKPGISNLLNIASALTGKDIKDIEKEFDGKGYGEFKKYVASVTSEFILKIQEKYNKLVDSEEINNILDEGIKESRKLAKEKYDLMKKRVGTTREKISK